MFWLIGPQFTAIHLPVKFHIFLMGAVSTLFKPYTLTMEEGGIHQDAHQIVSYV